MLNMKVSKNFIKKVSTVMFLNEIMVYIKKE
jgi:hypothetical protein